ncbi:MAG: C39 family peptidase [Bacteroidetes bacterium]|nr:C39 family peptidase [Bacteroidota bacterium]
MKKWTFLLLMALGLSGCTCDKGKLLDFPNTRQSYGYSCGPGAVQVVMAYYGEDFHESELIDMLKTDTSEGTYVRDIVKFFHFNGFTTRLKQKMTLDELRSYIDRGIPVITLIQAWGSKTDLKNGYKDCWNDGHFVVVIGYNDKFILFSDPSLYNTGYIPVSEFMSRWHDLDQSTIKTYQLGLAVYGRKPVFKHDQYVRIE